MERCLSKEEIVKGLSGKPNGAKVSITFAEDGESAITAGYLLGMSDNIITMDDATFIGIYDVATSGRWDGVSRTVEVTLCFKKEGDLEGWFAHRLRDSIVKLEVG